jgi:hypothetical protein
MLIPVKATEGQIAGDRRAAVLERDDVVDLEGEGAVILGELAVFAAAAGPLPDELDEVAVHAIQWVGPFFLRARRALAPSKSSSRPTRR